ncbi:unnamed protein product [Rotaria sp. Silwood2]|nr:unnamed protein product [Rotaria sp. Silwood2]CAF2966918.1 unnamed protein product [Rotaria sp. Silwood2]CAF3343001.1 unnamed protein product [Rotaria sp. Silwood2]CAF3407274.1 unnamed protein product [Rotaria sp. Silwood2]CAF4049985.1 unnamed protein product [Rotaria sp. Silwood2]
MYNCSLNTSYKSANDDVLTPLPNTKQLQSTIIQRSISTVATKNVKSSGYGQYQLSSTKRPFSTFGTAECSFRE